MSTLPAGLAKARHQEVAVARLAGLGFLLWMVAHQDRPGAGGEHLAVAVLMAGVALGWLAGGLGWSGWLSSRSPAEGVGPRLAALVVMAAAGGALAAMAPIAMTFPAVAALGAGIGLDSGAALSVAAVGTASVVVAGAGYGAPAGFMISGSLATVAGAMAGRSRRQYTERARQAESLLAERLRADTERDRAAALAERNRIAREIHDVLAHSLGALAVQLEAADALLEVGADRAESQALVRKARVLAVEGLAETRRAVHALRDEPVALAEQLGSLAAQDGAALSVTGTVRRLSPGAGVALYRAAQEALTNARKHAPGAAVTVRLDFHDRDTVLTVTNASPDRGVGLAPLASTGGGFGLAGMRERVELVGGSVSAGPQGSGFAVRATVPE